MPAVALCSYAERGPKVIADDVLYRCVRQLLAEEAELFGKSAEDAQVLKLDGVVASINPRAPDRSLFNWVACDGLDALAAAYTVVSQRYERAGVRAWTVWVDPGDSACERFLQARGHRLDGRPRAMAAELDALSLPDVADFRWEETKDMRVVAALNDAAYGFPPPAFQAALLRCENPCWHAYVARQGERAVGCAMAYESPAGDCGVSGVATLPEARGRGVASRLLGVAIQEARRRGARTTSLQASSKGASVYARLGYRDLGAMSMWEHRPLGFSAG